MSVSASPGFCVLTAAAVSVVVDLRSGVPRVLHWGPRIGQALASDEDYLATLAEAQHGADGLTGAGRIPAVVPEQSTGWTGTPGLEGHRDGTAFSTRFLPSGHQLTGSPDGPQRLTSEAVDRDADLALRTTIELGSSGVLRMQVVVANAATETDYTVQGVRLVLPVPAEAQELLDFAGRRRGRTGSDAAYVMAAGTSGFGFGRGEVWAVHTAWSGNHATFAELNLSGVRLLGGGEVLLPGEVVLAPGESYETPWLYAAYGRGLDDLSGAFHEHLRCRPQHPRSPRRVVLNTWEAVYFDHDIESLRALAERAAEVGVERFVLDDGWFLGRRDDRAGLGDWRVDPGSARWSRRCATWAWTSVCGSNRRWSARTPSLLGRTPSGSSGPAGGCRSRVAASTCSISRSPRRSPTCWRR
jgi:alpha-galactosidase